MGYDYFMIDFEDFILDFKNKTVKNSPAFEISYKLNNKSKFVFPSNGSPITYRLNSTETDETDLYFISNINNTLLKTLNNIQFPENFKFNLKLMSDSWMHQNPETFLYIQAGLDKDFYEKNKSSKEITSVIDNLAKKILTNGLKEQRKPSEIVFNYDFLGLLPSPQLADKRIRWEELEGFIETIKNKV